MQSDATELPVLEIPVHEITHVGISNDVEVTGPGLANSQPKSKKLPTILILWKSPRMLAAFWGGDFATATAWYHLHNTGLLCKPHISLVIITSWFDLLGSPPLILLRLVEHDSVRQIVLLCAPLILIYEL